MKCCETRCRYLDCSYPIETPQDIVSTPYRGGDPTKTIQENCLSMIINFDNKREVGGDTFYLFFMKVIF